MERKPIVGTRTGLQLHSMEVSSADKFENAFKEAIKAGSAALPRRRVGGSIRIKNGSRTSRTKIVCQR